MGEPLDDELTVACPDCRGRGRTIVYGYIGRDFMPRDPQFVPCPECNGSGRISEARAYDLSIAAAEQREMSADDEAHAWRERMDERREGR